METPRALREQARRLRTLANAQDAGTADALIEAACALELRVGQLEGEVAALAVTPLNAAAISRR